MRADYIQGIYHTILLRDIVARKKITDIELLESVIRFLFDNIGNIVSSKKIADSLTSFGRKTNSVTIENYLVALQNSYVLYKVSRYDVKGKQHLKSLEEYYVADISLGHLALDERERELGRILESIVFLELIRRGYSVKIGKVGEREVDFVATVRDQRCYYQVAASVLDPATFDREYLPLNSIKDHYPKVILSLDDLPVGQDGIQQMNIVDWLLET